MKLLDTWKKLEQETLSQPVAGTIIIDNVSRHPLQKLSFIYRANAGFIIVFLVCFGILFFLFQEPLVKGSLILLMLFYFLGLVLNLITRKRLKLNITPDQNVKSVLENTYTSVLLNVRFQERFSLLFYPIAGVTGFFMGIAIMSTNLNSVIRERYVLITLFAVLIVLTPLCYLLTKHLHKISYGKSLQELRRLITELEKTE